MKLLHFEVEGTPSEIAELLNKLRGGISRSLLKDKPTSAFLPTAETAKMVAPCDEEGSTPSPAVKEELTPRLKEAYGLVCRRGQPLSVKEIAEALSINVPNAGMLLGQLVGMKKLVRVGRGLYVENVPTKKRDAFASIDVDEKTAEKIVGALAKAVELKKSKTQAYQELAFETLRVKGSATVDVLQKAMKLSRPYTYVLLSELAREEKIKRLKPGVYALPNYVPPKEEPEKLKKNEKLEPEPEKKGSIADKVLAFLREKQTATSSELKAAIGGSPSHFSTVISGLLEDKKIKCIRPGKYATPSYVAPAEAAAPKFQAVLVAHLNKYHMHALPIRRLKKFLKKEGFKVSGNEIAECLQPLVSSGRIEFRNRNYRIRNQEPEPASHSTWGEELLPRPRSLMLTSDEDKIEDFIREQDAQEPHTVFYTQIREEFGADVAEAVGNLEKKGVIAQRTDKSYRVNFSI